MKKCANSNAWLRKAFYVSALAILSLTGCKKDLDKSQISISNVKGSITPYVFDWETVDWMPTPAGQSLIAPPWIGQGSIASVYGTDVINDHKAADGWVLVYNTFDPNATGPLVNPYFMLYNSYRGLLRIYLYTTTQFVAASTYLQDGLSVVSSNGSTMLNFLGKDVVDAAERRANYSQIEPAPNDGSLPLASNKWYMLQYELAYDPQVVNTSYQNIQLSWFTNYYGVANISLGGTIEGTIKGTTGASSSQANTFSALQNGGKVLGTGVLAGVGSLFINNNTRNATTGENSLGLPNSVFKSIANGISGALSGATGGIPGAITNVFSAIFGGSSAGQTMNFALNANINLTGTSTSGGSFPSSPTSVWVPGSIISPLAQNYIPLYNETMGVFNLSGRPSFDYLHTTARFIDEQNVTPKSVASIEIRKKDNAGLIQINPAVSNIASVTVISQEQLILFAPTTDNILRPQSGHSEQVGIYPNVFVADPSFSSSSIRYAASPSQTVIDFIGGVRFTLRVTPNNGAPPVTIVKTFLADMTRVFR
jgi:hypothetical protein